ncbi:trimeric intracellular cation channel family protein [Agarivorans sp. 1_MG-2023]|uniref:trimeric intracellular cation channel family protein n=1 Tax=Agarivorans sp. 1_MG-2023 TaxID=3062634 RepID=UPI0026E174CF|nr:trimeric intracellular cation channel family protein [Agarivorans sp. 1_MG-2023]MDO6764239.1 trimeric intracellular cation channel family protein [Agarivorans sp. 1_MG-2023]
MGNTILFSLDLFGTAVFAISGVLVASRRKMDLFGALVLACVTAIGGGTIRDMALGASPVFWVENGLYLWVILIASLSSVLLLNNFPTPPRWLLPVADAIGMAVFMAIGAEKALQYGAPMIVAVTMGVITACGGGMIRDVLANQVPLVLQREVYATACIVGGLVWVAALFLEFSATLATSACIFTALIIRLVAIRYHLSLPKLAKNRQ